MKGWNDFYTDVENNESFIQIIAKAPFAKQSCFTEGNIYIRNSLFDNLTGALYGGAIFVNSTDYDAKFLIEDSQFNYCHAQESGGALYIKNCNSVMNYVCGFDCNTVGFGNTLDGPFANTFASENDALNYVFNSQISHCINKKWGFVMSMHIGNIKYSYSNVSKNECDSCSALYLEGRESDLDFNNISYSSFRNNTAQYRMCLYLSVGKYSLRMTNIIENEQISDERGLVYVAASNCVIEDCCLVDNKGNLYATGKSATIKFINCTIDQPEGVISGVEISLTPEFSFIHGLKLLNTGNCYGTYDVLDELTPEIPTPEQTPKRTVNMCNKTCQVNKTNVISALLIKLSCTILLKDLL